MKTIAQQLKIKDFPFIINDKDGNEIYHETSSGFWCKCERDTNGNEIYHETSDGFWIKREYDAHGKEILFENSYGFWSKRERDAHGNEIYYENSAGKIIDKRPKVVEFTLQEIADALGINVTQLRIKENMKYKLNISNGCTASGHLEVNGTSYSCEDKRYELTAEQREQFHNDLFAEIRRRLDDNEIHVTDLVELLEIEDTHYSETCDQCGDNQVTTYYEFSI